MIRKSVLGWLICYAMHEIRLLEKNAADLFNISIMCDGTLSSCVKKGSKIDY